MMAIIIRLGLTHKKRSFIDEYVPLSGRSKAPLCLLLCWYALLFFACENPSDHAKSYLDPSPFASCTRKTGTASLPNQSAGEKIDPTREPRYKDQWYLKNTTGGIDINVEPVWQKGCGTKSVNVGILDQAIDQAHPDLKDNILKIREYYPYDTKKSHGTNVAGLIAASDNGHGIIGVAPRAKIYNYGMPAGPIEKLSQLLSNIAEALNSPEHKIIAVYNASLGGGNESIYHELFPPIKNAMDTVTKDGFFGKGSSLVFSAGNSYVGNTSNKSYFRHHAVIVVNAINKSGKIPNTEQFTLDSQTGVNIWVTAPTAGILTTQNEGIYEEDFGGTSAATPLVSGAIALLRSEFPKLTWRDVKLILAESAKKYDYRDRAQYKKSGLKYSDNSEQSHSRTMGFGLLDVEDAFIMVKNWTLLPPMQESTHEQNTPLSSIEKKEKATSTLEVTESGIDFIESVTLTMEIKKTKSPLNLNVWSLQLISPDGIEGAIYKHINISAKDYASISTNTLTFVVNSFLGSKADGIWKLEIQQNEKDIINEITDWDITFRGH